MATNIGVAHISLYFDDSFSLKDKRREMKSVLQKLRNQFNAGAAEVADLDDMRVGTIGLVCISNSHAHAQDMLATMIGFVERQVELGVVGEVETEIIAVGN